MADVPRAPLPQEDADVLARRRRGRNWALLVVLASLSALFYAIAIVKMAKSGHLS